MKKTFIAAAVGVAMAAPLSAFAAATLYGQAHGSVDFVETTYLDNDELAHDSEVAVSSNSSRIGVKGSENVGSMDVIYGMEWHVSMSDRNNGKELAARNRYVGLKSADFGTIVVGRMDTPSKKLGRSVDLFHSTQLGENRNVVSLHGGDDRRDNVIQWNSNNMSGFKAAVQYSADTGGNGTDTDADDSDALSISGTYTTGDIMVGASFDDVNEGNEIFRLAAKYTMGDLTFVGFYEDVDNLDGDNSKIPTAFGPAKTKLAGLIGTPDGSSSSSWGIGASMKNGKNTFKIAYYDASDIAGYDGLDGDLISVGVDHALSSSTMIYAVAADGSDAIAPAGAGHDDKTAGHDTSAVSFGIRKKF
jgi:predicted porin